MIILVLKNFYLCDKAVKSGKVLVLILRNGWPGLSRFRNMPADFERIQATELKFLKLNYRHIKFSFNKLIKALLSVLFWVACTSYLHSQDISGYLDDGIGSEGKNMLKIAFDPLNGELPLIFEHSFGRKFSLEAGAGPVWIAMQNRIQLNDSLPIKQNGVGFTIWVRPKLYFKTYPERFYLSSYPKLTIMDHKLFFDVAWLNIGYQRILWNRIVIAAEVGMEFRFYKSASKIPGEGSENQMNLLFPVLLNLGYLF